MCLRSESGYCTGDAHRDMFSAFVCKKDMFFAVAVISLALAFIVMQLPGAIGVCKGDGMDCHTTAAWFISCGGISFVSSIVGIVLNPKRKKVKTK